jgi:DNA-binding NarL/FixJ family response regulator
VIRILIVDDHPALRAGLTAVLRAEHDLQPLGAAATAEDMLPALQRTKPDIVLLDYHLPRSDGLVLCRRIKSGVPVPAVLLYSAYAGAGLTIPAALAGADGIVNKAAPARELFETIRRVAAGERVMPAVSRELLDAATRTVDRDDLPILGMMLEHTPLAEIAAVLGVGRADVTRRVDRMIGQLHVDVPAPRPAV